MLLFWLHSPPAGKQALELVPLAANMPPMGWDFILCGVCAPAVLHTSASLTINENASPDVPLDLNVSHGRHSKMRKSIYMSQLCLIDCTYHESEDRACCCSLNVPSMIRYVLCCSMELCMFCLAH